MVLFFYVTKWLIILDVKISRPTFLFYLHYSLSVGQTSSKMTTTTPMHESGPAIEFSHKVEVELRMASVCYLHSTAFIRELNSCASDFLHFLSQVASSITTGWTTNDAVFLAHDTMVSCAKLCQISLYCSLHYALKNIIIDRPCCNSCHRLGIGNCPTEN